jgi:hypothetical protein
MANENPKLFISYSWSNPEHQQWVINLATELRESGIDVILDKWDLKEGHDSIAFMEKMVSDPKIKKVAIICDRVYAEKADGRSGGVGTETQIISPEIYSKADQTKFVAVLSEKDEQGNAYLPTYYKSRIYIDLSSDELYASNFEQLLRWIYDKPLHVKPPIGKEPSFLSEDNPITLETTTKYRRAIEAVKSNKEYADGAIDEYLSTFAQNLERFRIAYEEKDIPTFDDKVIDNIEKFLPFRNEILNLFSAIAQYRDSPQTIQQLHRFFENLIPYTRKPKGMTAWKDWDFDNFLFIVRELFVYTIAFLIKHERFSSASYLMRMDYYAEEDSDYGKGEIIPSPVLAHYLSSLEQRNKRLKLRRVSLYADLLIQRSNIPSITERQLIQADFVLFIRNCFDAIRNKVGQSWWPITIIYAGRLGGPCEIFVRSRSKAYFDKVKILFDIQQKDDFIPFLEAFKNGGLHAPKFNYIPFEIESLIGFDKLATLP